MSLPPGAPAPVSPDAANPDTPSPEAASSKVVSPNAAPSEAVTPDVAGLRFDQFGLAPGILKAINEQGYTTPTPIQAAAIPIVLAGRDVMGAAQTGTGKTAAFTLPILQKLLPLASSSMSPARHPVRALILSPTRELADQIAVNVVSYSKHTDLRSAVVFGGVDIVPQLAELRRGVEILIATPGRLLDHVQQKTANLSQVQILVLDEADRMLDMGFLPDIQRIVNLLPASRQSLMFSATFSNEIKKLAATFLRNPETIEVARRNAASENVTQQVFMVRNADEKRHAVGQLIRDRKLSQVIVFSNTKIGAGRLARQLEKEGLKAGAIHGDKSQSERLTALDAFKNGGITVLVATDVAARGIDIAELPAVINFDLPHSPEDYVHRIGRTGRAGASGEALSLMAPEDERYLSDIEKLIKRKIDRQTLQVLASDGPREASGASYRDGSREPARDRNRTSGERRDRRETGDAAERPIRRREYEDTDRPRRFNVPHARKPVEDEWFSRPYVPSADSAASVATRSPQGSGDGSAESGLRPKAGALTRPARPVAALLGGKKSA